MSNRSSKRHVDRVTVSGNWMDAVAKSLAADPSKLPPREAKPRTSKKKASGKKPKAK